MQKGKPLPEKGACKHYKQSHRWLRYRHCNLSHFTCLTWKNMKNILTVLCHRLPSGFPAVAVLTPVMCAMTRTRTTPWNWPPGWSVATVPKNRWAIDLTWHYILAIEPMNKCHWKPYYLPSYQSFCMCRRRHSTCAVLIWISSLLSKKILILFPTGGMNA